jgi:spermidine synthase
MTVASHLGIRLEEYDTRIRTFIPPYDEMLDVAAGALRVLHGATPHIVDLGTGTGALALRCLRELPDASLTAIDQDAGILDTARQRLASHGARVSLVLGDFAAVPLPPCDALVASLTLHHVRTGQEKQVLYRRCRAALSSGGLLVLADCCPSVEPRLAALERAAWRGHLRRTYSDSETDGFFAAWAEEDVYLPLSEEITLMREAGLLPDVVWRRGCFAVIAAFCPAVPID